jgi:hypothetical protein
MEAACFVVQVVVREPGLSVVEVGWGKDWLAQSGEDFCSVPQIFGHQRDADSP